MPRDAKSYAPRILPSTWKQHECTIKELFVDQNKTLSNVAEIMKTYGFQASESQYERQLKAWGIRKNRTRDEWRLINRVVKERRHQGKDSAVLIFGIKQPSERISRELARSGYPRHAGFEYDLPGYIQVLTPPATPTKADAPPGHTKKQYPARLAVASFTYTYRKSTETIFDWELVKHEKESASTRASESSRDEHCSISLVDLQLESWMHDMIKQLGRVFRKRLGILGSDWESIIQYRSPLEYLSISSWESVGVTFEDWVTQRWNILFGDWDSEGDRETPDLIGYGFACTFGDGRWRAWFLQEVSWECTSPAEAARYDM